MELSLWFHSGFFIEMAKKIKYNLIKKRRTYTVAELATIVKCHPRTIQQWIKNGMEVIDPNSKPYLISGIEAKQFLQRKSKKAKVKLQNDEFYCIKCRTAVTSLLKDTKTRITGKRIGKGGTQAIIEGICQNCNTPLRRFSTVEKISELKIGSPSLTERPIVLIENDSHSLNTDIMERLNEY